ncbi:unnamed protein product [Rotaria sp. Silwood2]|nr:unnamed protein product [Rotaria sp. Silwood2]
MMLFHLVEFLLLIESIKGITSPITPYTKYNHSVKLKTNIADLWWTINETKQEILFELHIHTTGWIALGNKFLIESIDQDFIHHILMYECDLMVQFNDSNLPEGFCNKTKNQIELCRFNVAGDYMIEYPSEAGYPIGGDFNIKYYMIEIHFNNPNQISSIQYN